MSEPLPPAWPVALWAGTAAANARDGERAQCTCAGRLVRATLTLDWAGQARLPRGVSGAGLACVGECGVLLCA